MVDSNLRLDGTSDVSQIDINPLSPTYNQTRTINRQDEECVNTTNTVFSWVDLGTLCGDNEVLCNNGIQEVSINSYTVSQKYKTIGSGDPIPMDEYQVTLNLENDEDCGYIPPQYRWDVVQGEYICDEKTYTKYETLMHMVSYDRGMTWSAVEPIETKRGDVLAYDSYDCGKPMERWVEAYQTVCEDNSDYWKLKIVGASSTAVVPCDESEVLTNDDLPPNDDLPTTILSDVSSIDFGNCITRIDCHMSVSFGSSENPATVHFGDYVEVIGNGSKGILNGYLKYDEDSFDENLRIINKNAFLSGNNTYSDNILYLGSKIESIGYRAFYNENTNLNTVKIDTVTPPSIGVNSFFHFGSGRQSLNCILVPKGSVDSYKSAWYEVREYIHSLAEENTFYRATYSDGTKGWNFSSEGTNGVLYRYMVEASYKGRFKSSITDVYLSNNVTEIGERAFQNCSGLTEITIPNTVTKIGSHAFDSCSGLTSLTFEPIQNGVIESTAFEKCRGLRRINIGSGVTKIEDMAFFDILTHDAADDDYRPSESEIVVYCYATTPPEVRTNNVHGDFARNSPFVYTGSTNNIIIDDHGWKKGYLYKPVVYVHCSSMLAYKASNWNDICVLRPIEDDCGETRWVADGYVCINGEKYANEGKEKRYPNGDTWTEWEDTGERRVGTSSLGSCEIVDLNNQWQESTSYGYIDYTSPHENFDFYESFSNKGVDSSTATMFITIEGYTSFTFKVRNYSNKGSDFVVVNNLDDTTIPKWPPSVGSGTASSGKVYYKNNPLSAELFWNNVTFDNIDRGKHIITVTYGKDGSGSPNDDRGYVAIPKTQ